MIWLILCLILGETERIKAVLSDNDFARASDSLKINRDSSVIDVFTMEAFKFGSLIASKSQLNDKKTRFVKLLSKRQYSYNLLKPDRENLLQNLLSILIQGAGGADRNFELKY